MGTAISQVLASLEPCFYARSIVRMALKRLTEKHSSSDEFSQEIVFLILPQQNPLFEYNSQTKNEVLPTPPSDSTVVCCIFPS